MIYTMIVYSSLLSASWMSAVSAVLTSRQLWHIRQLDLRTEFSPDWTQFYDETDRHTLDEYLIQTVNTLGDKIRTYMYTLNINVNYAENLPPRPNRNLRESLVRVRKLVFLIWFSNLTILYDIKRDLQSLGFIPEDPILRRIDDEYLQSVPNRYLAIRVDEPTMWVDAATIDVAVLFCLNKTMRNYHQSSGLQNNRDPRLQNYQEMMVRLKDYQTMIRGLYGEMAHFMRVQSGVRYSRVMQVLTLDIAKLENDGVYGFREPRIQTVVTNLADAILAVIVIFGRETESGGMMLFELLKRESTWAIRRKLGVEPRLSMVDEWLLALQYDYGQALLANLRDALGSRWVYRRPDDRNFFEALLPLANRLMRLGERTV